MQLASGSHIPDGLLAANALLSEKLHQGFAAPKSTLHQGFGVSISSTPLGIISPLYDDGIGSRYTGKERDTESGLDYFGARYYASNMGRWMSPDWSAKEEPVPYAKLDDPQTLNLYSYVANNPLSRADADGHCFWDLCIGEGAAAYAAVAFVATAATVAVEGYIHSPQGQAAIANVSNSVSHATHVLAAKAAAAVAAAKEQGRDAKGKFTPKEGGEANPGAAAEATGLAGVGATKNTETINGTIRDGTVTATGEHVEVKSGAVVSNTEQLAKMGQAAVDATGKALIVVTTNPNVKVTGPAQNNPNLDIRPHQ